MSKKIKICFSSSYHSQPFIASFLARCHLVFTTMPQQKDVGQTRFFLREQCPDLEGTTTIVYWGEETGLIDFGHRVREDGLLSRVKGHDCYVGENKLSQKEFKIPLHEEGGWSINCCSATDGILKWILDCSSDYGMIGIEQLEGEKAVDEISKDHLTSVDSFRELITEYGYTDLSDFHTMLEADSVSIEKAGAGSRRRLYNRPHLTDLATYDDTALEHLLEDCLTAVQYRKRLGALEESAVDTHHGFNFPMEVWKKLAGASAEPEPTSAAEKVYDVARKLNKEL